MSNLIKNIFEITSSKSYITYNTYHEGNLFGITKTSRLESMHSNFIAWLLNSSSSHALGTFPIMQFVRCLEFLKDKNDNKYSRFDKDVIKKFYDDAFTLGTKVKRENQNIDILIEITTQEKILPIIIENKVNSKEHGKKNDQTKKYFLWGENEYADSKKYFQPIYILLYPKYNNMIQSEERFIRMTYQELVNNVIEPSLYKCGDTNSIKNINDYLHCLSYQSDNEKGDQIMAISNEERQILMDFISENKNLLYAVLNELSTDNEIDVNAIEKITTSVKDYSLYTFNGQKGLKKSQLALAIVKKYVDDYGPENYVALEKVFHKSIQGHYGVIKLLNKVTENEKGTKNQPKRYHVDNPIILSCGDEVVVCTQWSKNNIENLIYTATSLGYNIIRE